jgi:hypothetical protein
MIRRTSTRIGMLGVAAVLAFGTGCAGPQSHVAIDGKQVGLDVAFGKPSAAVLKGSPPLSPVPSGVGVLPVHDQSGNGTTIFTDQPGKVVVPPLPNSCPRANPFSSPTLTADNIVSSSAPHGVFRYGFSGFAVTGSSAKSFAGQSSHTVTSSTLASPQPQEGISGSYRFDVTVPMLGATTTYTYAVAPGPGTAANVQGGIELVQVTGHGGYGYTASFHPDKPVQLFSQPANSGTTWTDTESDIQSGTVATVSGVIDGHGRVDACGTRLDAWKSTVTLKLTSANENITATVQTWWGTQFGGLPLQEVQSYSGTTGNGSVAVKGELTSTIAVDPSTVKQ